MKYCSQNKLVTFAGLVCSVLLLSACATSANKHDQVEDRAMGRWDALLAGDLATAYEYLTPGFRSSVSSINYQRSQLMKRLKWTNAEYIGSDCEETICKVKISIDFVVYAAVPGVKSFEESDIIEESWLLVDGEWYFRPLQ